VIECLVVFKHHLALVLEQSLSRWETGCNQVPRWTPLLHVDTALDAKNLKKASMAGKLGTTVSTEECYSNKPRD
jgi:hypothetical protein